MELLDIYKKIFAETTSFEESKSYYYHTHQCESPRVMLDYELKDSTTGEMLRIGHCEVCKKTFYHKTVDSKNRF